MTSGWIVPTAASTASRSATSRALRPAATTSSDGPRRRSAARRCSSATISVPTWPAAPVTRTRTADRALRAWCAGADMVAQDGLDDRRAADERLPPGAVVAVPGDRRGQPRSKSTVGSQPSSVRILVESSR